MTQHDHRPPQADATSDETEGAAHVPHVPAADAARRATGAPDRQDPHPDQVPGEDDAGARGRDRENGGWGDRGIGGGRAGGTGP